MRTEQADKEIVQMDMDSLYIGNLNTVEFDLLLPEEGIYGSKISWKSGHERFLTDDGKVTRPAYGMGERKVPLYATFSYGNAKECKTYEVRILEEENKLSVSKVHEVRVEAAVGQTIYLPQAAIVETDSHDTIAHPVVWTQGSEVMLSEEGSFRFEGVLAGTKIPVMAIARTVPAMGCEWESAKPVVWECAEADVRLLEGSEFYEAQERMREFLLSVDDDQMLYNFRAASGLDTQTSLKMSGWDAPDSQLRGHTTGHYMSALALCYQATGDTRIYKKAEYMVQEMGRCQKAFAGMEGIHEGFLSGYSEEQFDLLEEYTPYPEIWAPYYTLHKLLAGLLDCYRLLDQAEALETADRLGMWVWKRLSRLSHDQLTRMWSMYIAGEFGGMNAVMAQLYQLTERLEFLQCAKLFDNDKLFYPLEQKTDALSTMHVNQHIPQMLGAMEIYKTTGEKRYYDMAEFFWKTVTSAHAYATGGIGEGEMFHERGRIGSLLTKNTEETCASYNMLKLTKELFQYNPKVKYMEYYERTVTNHILASLDKQTTGESTYFLPLGPGMKREFLCENSCCHGTGMESQFKYREGIYFQDAESIYINLYIPSELRWEDKDFIIRQESDSTDPGHIKLFVQGTGWKNVKIRKPEWAEDYHVLEDDKVLDVLLDIDGYIQISQNFFAGKTYEIEFSLRFHFIRTPDRPELAAIQYGPYILAALSEQEDYIRLPYTESELEEKMVQIGHKLEFFCEDIIWIPLSMVDEEAYHVYVYCPQEVTT